MRGGSLMFFARNVHSQNGEDGIVAELVRRLGIAQPGTFVEFGAGNGVDLSNTLALAERGWSGAWIEANVHSAANAAQYVVDQALKVEVIHGVVGSRPDDNLDKMLASTKVPRALDVVSIDIDSDDLVVWQAIEEYRAKIVIIEINSGIPLGVESVHSFADGRQGNSFTSMLKLARTKGYTLACHTGNLIFVDDALAPKLGLPQSERERPESIFNDMWAKWAVA